MKKEREKHTQAISLQQTICQLAFWLAGFFSSKANTAAWQQVQCKELWMDALFCSHPETMQHTLHEATCHDQ